MGALERDLSKKREVYDRGLLWKSGEVVGVLPTEGGLVGGWGGERWVGVHVKGLGLLSAGMHGEGEVWLSS